jgi:hypothetical protein
MQKEHKKKLMKNSYLNGVLYFGSKLEKENNTMLIKPKK